MEVLCADLPTLLGSLIKLDTIMMVHTSYSLNNKHRLGAELHKCVTLAKLADYSSTKKNENGHCNNKAIPIRRNFISIDHSNEVNHVEEKLQNAKVYYHDEDLPALPSDMRLSEACVIYL